MTFSSVLPKKLQKAKKRDLPKYNIAKQQLKSVELSFCQFHLIISHMCTFIRVDFLQWQPSARKRKLYTVSIYIYFLCMHIIILTIFALTIWTKGFIFFPQKVLLYRRPSPTPFCMNFLSLSLSLESSNGLISVLQLLLLQMLPK